MNIIRANEFGDDAKTAISTIFVDGFYQWLTFFSKDKAKLTKAFRHMFNLEVFYVVVIDNEIAGITACTDGKTSSVQLKRKEFTKSLGFLRGTITYLVLKQQFEKKPYPFEIAPDMGMIEFVAVSMQHRGHGVATAILKYILEHTAYREYALEVADTNTNAVKLYEKLGFRVFLRMKQKHSKRSGVNDLLYMKYVKGER